MEIDKLRVVSPDSTGNLRIVNNGENSYLVNGDTIVTERTKSPDRPLHCSELDKKLKLRDWHKFDTKFIGTDGKLYSRIYSKIKPNDVIDVIETNPNSENIEEYSDYAYLCCDDIVLELPETTEEEGVLSLDRIDLLYEKIFGAMKEKEISFYSVPKRVINILDGSTVFDLIRYDSSEYTDTVSLGEVLHFTLAPVEYGRIDLGVQYSKSGDNASQVYSCDTNFTAFSYVDGKLVVNELVGDINNEVGYEFLNGVIKVSPLNNEINECIISYCTITYGRN